MATNTQTTKVIKIVVEGNQATASINDVTVSTKKLNQELKQLSVNAGKGKAKGSATGGATATVLELGRTMMVDAKIVLLDEVGAGVNRTLLNDIVDTIKKLNTEKNYTFFMIEHDMNFLSQLCDKVIVMTEGSVLVEGNIEEIKKNEKVIEAYLGRDDNQ